MGVLIPVGYGEGVWIFRGPGATKNCTMTMGFHDGSVSTAGTVAGDLYDAVNSGVSDNLCEATSMVVGWQLLGTDFTYMDDSGPILGSYRVTTTGTKSGSPLPTNCAFLASKGTATGGRKGRGRWFIPPFMLGESGVDGNGIIDSGILPTLQGYLDAVMAQFVTLDLHPVLLHSTAGTPAPITALTLQSQLATQRRRMR